MWLEVPESLTEEKLGRVSREISKLSVMVRVLQTRCWNPQRQAKGCSGDDNIRLELTQRKVYNLCPSG